MFHGDVWDLFILDQRSKFTKPLPAWVFALFWVLASSSHQTAFLRLPHMCLQWQRVWSRIEHAASHHKLKLTCSNVRPVQFKFNCTVNTISEWIKTHYFEKNSPRHRTHLSTPGFRLVVFSYCLPHLLIYPWWAMIRRFAPFFMDYRLRAVLCLFIRTQNRSPTSCNWSISVATRNSHRWTEWSAWWHDRHPVEKI